MVFANFQHLWKYLSFALNWYFALVHQFCGIEPLMCSFLHVFLFLYVILTALQDSVPHWNKEEAFQTPMCSSPGCLVQPSDWEATTQRWSSFETQEDISRTSLEGFEFSSCNTATHQYGSRTISMALCQVPKNQQEDGGQMCDLQFSLDHRNETQNRTSCTSLSPGQIVRLGEVGKGRPVMAMANDQVPFAVQAFRKIACWLNVQGLSKPTWAKGQRQRPRQGQRKKQEEVFRGSDAHGWGFHSIYVPASGYRTCSLALDRNYFCRCSSIDISDVGFQSICYGIVASEERMCGCTSNCLSGRLHHTHGNAGDHRQAGQGHRETGERKQQICYEKYPLGNDVPWQSAEVTHRDAGSPKGTPTSVGQTHHRGCDYLGESAQGVQEATSHFPRDCYQGKGRHRSSPECHPGTLLQSSYGCTRSNAQHSESQCRTGRKQHGTGSGGREIAHSAPKCPAELCISAGHGCHQHRLPAGDGRSYGRRRWRESSQAQTPASFGALWRWTWIWCWTSRAWHDLSVGGDALVRGHGAHDASTIACLADAYVIPPVSHAACHPQLTQFDLNRFAHWRHSIQDEPTFLNQFDAVISAWKMSWSLICDAFHSSSVFAQGTSIDLPESMHSPAVFDNSEPLNQCDVCAFEHPSLALRSCIRSSSEHRHRISKSVCFHDMISIHIGLEDELHMSDTPMHLSEWRLGPKSHGTRNSHCL